MPIMHIYKEDYPNGDRPPVLGVNFSYNPCLLINDPEMLNELYVTKNRFFDKHFLIKDILSPLMGDSTLLAHSTENWAKRRKSLSGTFYKDKLVKMMEMV